MSYHKVEPKKLLLSFPQMQKTLESFPATEDTFSSSDALRAWAAESSAGDSAAHIINLVCAVIDGGYSSGDFGLFEAMSKWDASNKEAFKNWLNLAFP